MNGWDILILLWIGAMVLLAVRAIRGGTAGGCHDCRRCSGNCDDCGEECCRNAGKK